MPAPRRPGISASTSPADSSSLPCTTTSSMARNGAAGSSVAAVHPPKDRPPANAATRATRAQCRLTPSASRAGRGPGARLDGTLGGDVLMPPPPPRGASIARRRLPPTPPMGPAPRVSTRSPGRVRPATNGATSARVRTWCTGRSVPRRTARASRSVVMPGRGGLPRREDVHEHDDVRGRQHRGEPVEEPGRPGVPMRLEDHHQPVVRLPAGRREHRRDLGRMMAVVVDDPHPGRRAAMLEPPAHPGEPPEAGRDRVRLEPQLQADGEGREPVQQVVPPRHGELQPRRPAPLPPREAHAAPRPVGAAFRFAARDVGRPVLDPVGHDPPLDAVPQARHPGVVPARHHRARLDGPVGETDEGVAQAVERPVVVEMLRLEIREDRDAGSQGQQRRFALVGLDHEVGPVPDPRVAVEGVDPRPHQRRRIQPALGQHHRHHRRRRALAVRPGHRDGRPRSREPRQHDPARHHRQAAAPGLHDLGVVVGHRGRDDHRVGAGDPARVVAGRDRDPARPQPRHGRRRGQIRAAHLVAETAHHFGHPAHADAAHAHEVHPPRPRGEAVGARPRPRFPPPPGCVVRHLFTGRPPLPSGLRPDRR